MIAETWATEAVVTTIDWTPGTAHSGSGSSNYDEASRGQNISDGSPACPPRSFGMGHGAPTCPYTVSAQRSADGATLYVRVTAVPAANITLLIGGNGGRPVQREIEMSVLSASDPATTNTAASPARISPRRSSLTLGSSGTARLIPVPANSFTILQKRQARYQRPRTSF